METQSPQNIVIVGCGRVGAELALSIYRQGHNVAIVDSNPQAFDRLGANFLGRTVQGEAIDRDVLKRADIEHADAFAAVTTSDSVNIVAARVAKDIFNVAHVVARVYNPRRAPIYEKLGIQTITSSSWGAKRMEQLMLHSGLQSVYTAGHGEVQIYEISVPHEWEGRTIGDLLSEEAHLRVVALARGGRGALPERATVLQAHDILQVSATDEGAALLRRRLRPNGGK